MGKNSGLIWTVFFLNGEECAKNSTEDKRRIKKVWIPLEQEEYIEDRDRCFSYMRSRTIRGSGDNVSQQD